MFSTFPPERMVMELVQNAFDEDTTICEVRIIDQKNYTQVIVNDDSPEGFRNMRDAYTLFGSTNKRTDPTKRGRFNFGEKIVLARANGATVRTTKGTIFFDDSGRVEIPDHTEAGSEIEIKFPRWTVKEMKTAIPMLERIYPPHDKKYTLNGKHIQYKPPHSTSDAVLATEYSKLIEGQAVMSRTRRKTSLHFHETDGQAYLFEMGLPVCPIEGRFDVDVQQKVPLSQDRTLVPESYMQDIYAEMLRALHEEIEADEIGQSYIRMALEDERTDAETASALFRKSFGADAVIQSHDPDSDQEAARQGVNIVSSRTFGSAVNAKLRSGGVQTTKEAYCRNVTTLTASGLSLPDGYRELDDSPERVAFIKYVRFLSERLYGHEVEVVMGHWMGQTSAMYQYDRVVFNTFAMGRDKIKHPVSRGTSLILHELAHSQGRGHDGVYDREYERLVNAHTVLLAQKPELYQMFEPELFEGA